VLKKGMFLEKDVRRRAVIDSLLNHVLSHMLIHMADYPFGKETDVD
jgi:hypothetical protein